MKIIATEILTTAQCPLNCRYCYIPKTSVMRKLHEEIIKNIRNGTLLENLKKIFPNKEDLNILSFWGTEPSLTLKEIADILPQILEHFPKLNTLQFSTSLLLPNEILAFILKVEKISPNLNIRIQISIDGPPFITDKNRGRGVAKVVSKNFIWLISKIQKVKNKITFHWKSTLGPENFEDFLEKESRFKEYFEYFKKVEGNAKKINKNQNIILPTGSPPTIILPGKYTSKDGKIFAKWLEKLHQKNYKSVYTFRLQRLLALFPLLGLKKSMVTCSASVSEIALYNELHICHRSFYINDQRYLESILREKKIENWDVSYFRKGVLNYFAKWYIIPLENQFSKTRLFYVTHGVHDFWEKTIEFIKSVTKQLVLVRQADPIFLKDEGLLELFALFLSSQACIVENFFNTGSIHFVPLSIIRIFGNGAFQEILYSLKNYERDQ